MSKKRDRDGCGTTLYATQGKAPNRLTSITPRSDNREYVNLKGGWPTTTARVVATRTQWTDDSDQGNDDNREGCRYAGQLTRV